MLKYLSKLFVLSIWPESTHPLNFLFIMYIFFLLPLFSLRCSNLFIFLIFFLIFSTSVMLDWKAFCKSGLVLWVVVWMLSKQHVLSVGVQTCFDLIYSWIISFLTSEYLCNIKKLVTTFWCLPPNFQEFELRIFVLLQLTLWFSLTFSSLLYLPLFIN